MGRGSRGWVGVVGLQETVGRGSRGWVGRGWWGPGVGG